MFISPCGNVPLAEMWLHTFGYLVLCAGALGPLVGGSVCVRVKIGYPPTHTHTQRLPREEDNQTPYRASASQAGFPLLA